MPQSSFSQKEVASRLSVLEREVIKCQLCPRLVDWRRRVAAEKRASFRDEEYWGKAVPGFGDPAARLLIIGLAPAAHGANRTGRMFTGDRSGDWLYRALYRAGFATQPEAEDREDGLELKDAWVTATVRCAPPGNKPTTQERETCRPYLESELDLFDSARVIVTLGGFAFASLLRIQRARGASIDRPMPKFRHGVEVEIDGKVLLASYHPSQQNTFTGTLTEPMFDAIWARAAELITV
tara:strand:- start:1316 stop:2029 length:714 start_codon:yes stop_codon:yes gene_type:complete